MVISNKTLIFLNESFSSRNSLCLAHLFKGQTYKRVIKRYIYPKNIIDDNLLLYKTALQSGFWYLTPSIWGSLVFLGVHDGKLNSLELKK